MSCVNCVCNKYPQINGTQLNKRIQALTNFSGLMVVGESPTAVECTRGILMSGAGAQVLKETLQKVDMPFKEDEVYYTTAVKCAVPKKKGQKFPASAPVNCREYLLNEIRAVQPKMILVCGATALQTLTGRTDLKVTELYGRILEESYIDASLKSSLGGSVSIIPIMNPGVLIHKPGDYKPFLSYLQLASTIFNGGDEVDTGETHWIVCDTPDKCRDLWKQMMDLCNAANAAGEDFNVSFDIETTGLDYRVVEFLVLGICFKKNEAYVIPREMRKYAHNFLSGVPWKCIWQHGKYDKKVMWRRGLADISIDEDTIYQHYVLDETSAHDLGYLTKVFLNAKEYKYKMNQNWKNVTLETYPQYFDALCERVAVDVDYTLQLHHVLDKELHKPENACLEKVYRELLIPAANFLSRVEQNGCLINAKYLDDLDVKYQGLLEDIMNEIETLAAPYWDPELYKAQTGAKSASPKFKPGSPAQMAWMVFDRLKLKPRVKKGRSTGKDILESIEDAPLLISKVLEFRRVQKEHSTYVRGLLDWRDEDGRVRTNFTLHVTATGRLSSKEPNVQNQPSANGVGNIRKAFIAPPGYILGEIDYSGAELRWLAFLSGDEALLKIFKEGRNLHKETATKMFGEHFTKQEKMIAKALNFGIAYGREAGSIADTFNISLAEAQGHIDNWFKAYPGAHDYLEWCAHQVELGKYLETPWGRRRRFGLVNPASLHSLQNEAKNFPIQSSSSDTLLWCCVQHEKEITDMGVRIIDLIHDSALVEIPADPRVIKEFGSKMNQWMIDAPVEKFNCPVPFKTDFEIGINWGDLGGTEFDYNVDPLGEDVINIEMPDDSIVQKNFYTWYNEVVEKEDRYDEFKAKKIWLPPTMLETKKEG